MKFALFLACFYSCLLSLQAQPVQPTGKLDYAWMGVRVLTAPDTSLELIDTLSVKTTSYFANEDSNEYRVVKKAIIKINKAASLLGGDYVELNEPKIEPIRFLAQGYFALVQLDPFPDIHYPTSGVPTVGRIKNSANYYQYNYNTSYVNPDISRDQLEGYRCVISARILKSKHQSKINAIKAALTEKALFSVVSRYRVNASGAVQNKFVEAQIFSIANYEVVNNRLYAQLELRGVPVHKFEVVQMDESKLLLSWKQDNSGNNYILAFKTKSNLVNK